MILFEKKPENFIVDLNNTPYTMDISPIAVGTRKYQAYLFMALGVIAFIATFAYKPVFVLLAVPLIGYAAYLFYTRKVLTFHKNYAALFTRDFINESKTEQLFYQNYDGIQVGTREDKPSKPPAYTITMMHHDKDMNLPLLDLHDGKRAYSLARLYSDMLEMELLPSQAFQKH